MKDGKVATVPSHIWSSREETTLYAVAPELEKRTNGEGGEKGSRTRGFKIGGSGWRIAEIVTEWMMIAVARVVLSTGDGGAAARADDLEKTIILLLFYFGK